MAREEAGGAKGSPSPSLSARSRQGSVSSVAVKQRQAKLGRALDDIHTSASQSGTLTSFNEFAAPPSLSSEQDSVHTSDGLLGLGSLYSRLRASVGPSSTSARGPHNDSVLDLDPTMMQRSRTPDSQKSVKAHSRANSRSILNGSPRPISRSTPPVSPMRNQERQKNAQEPRHRAKQPSSSASSALSAADGKTPRPLTPLILDPTRKPSDASEIKEARGVKGQGSKRKFKPSIDLQTRLDHVETTEAPLSAPIRHGSPPPLHRPRNMSRSATDPTLLRPAPPRPMPTLVTAADGVPSKPSTQAANSSGTVTPSERSFKALASLPTQEKQYQGNNTPAPNDLIYQMQHKVLSKDFWMKDENAKVCFNCGDSFTTFRRKHHCRLCGQIYCSSCTNLISGKPFGKSNKLRVCNTCNNMLHEDDSSDYSEPEETPTTPVARQIRFSEDVKQHQQSPARPSKVKQLAAAGEHPSGTPSPRRLADLGRAATTGAGIERDRVPPLARPSSSRSLRSLSGRPRSSSTRARRPRSQHMRSLSIGPDDAGFTRRRSSGDRSMERPAAGLKADSIVDPELHQFLSDDGSSDEDMPTIGAALSQDVHDGSGLGLGGFFSAIRKARPRGSGMSTRDGLVWRDADDVSVTSSKVYSRHKPLGRSLSVGSMAANATPNRLGRSDNLFRSSDNLYAMINHDGADRARPPLRSGESGVEARQLEKSQATYTEIDSVRLAHLKKLLHQCLHDSRVDHPNRWEHALIPVLLRCAQNVDPNVHRGDRIDIRTYVKIKKVPGGSPRNTALVDGLVFTNNIALRDMSRLIRNPRVLLISFPLIYTRHQHHFMSLEGVIAQEEEYLKNLSLRIARLEPNLVLVQGEVAGIVRKALQVAGITLVHDVKVSVLQAVSRLTQTRIVSSVDKLSMDSKQLGRCGLFEVKTFVQGDRKHSYVYISGCPSDLGCTIVLRGAEGKVLKKLKWISEFLAYIAYNLKLETCLIRDQFGAVAAQPTSSEHELTSDGIPAIKIDMDAHDGTYESMGQFLKQRILSASPLVTFPEPYLLKRGYEQEARLNTLQRLQAPESPMPEDETEDGLTTNFELIRPNMVYQGASNSSRQVREVLRAIHAAEYERAADSYAATKRRWEAYLSDVVEPFSPLTHQKIVLQHSIVSNATSNACVGPELLGFEYYQENDLDEGWERDLPLGEYIERLCDQADSPCTAGRCDSQMFEHHRQYVHGNGQVKFHVDKAPPRFKGMENTILMWSTCKLCKFETPVVPMSAETWKYSLGKYLELCFWSSSMRPRLGDCEHDINREHARYFGFRNISIRVCYSPINLVEIIVPRSTISWMVEKDLAVKNDLYQRIEERVKMYMSSVKLRLQSIKLDSINPDKLELCRSELEALTKRADGEYDYLLRELQRTYLSSRYYETVPLNRTLRSLQEKVAEWDTTFADFEANYFPSGKDLRRLAAIQFRKAFLEKEGLMSPPAETEKIAPEDLEVLDEKRALSAIAATADDATIDDESTLSPDPGVVPLSEASNLAPQQLESTGLVQSLDLALAQTTPRPPSSALLSPPSVAEALRPSSTAAAPPIRVSEPATPLDAEVVSRVEQMQKPSDTEQDSTEAMDVSPEQQKLSAKAPPLFRSKTSPIDGTLVSIDATEPSRQGPETPTMDEIRKKTPSPIPSMRLPQVFADRGIAPVRIGNIAMQSMIPRAIGSKRNDNSRVSALAKHFEQMSREFERERLRERRQRLARTRQSRAFPAASANPILEIFRDASEAVRQRETIEEEDPKKVEHHDSAETEPETHSYEQSVEEQSWFQPHKEDDESVAPSGEPDQSEENQLLMSYPGSDTEGVTSDAEMPDLMKSQDLGVDLQEGSSESPPEVLKQDTTILNKILASLWTERSASGWTQLDYPLTPNDHIFADSDLIVREDEPSSLIAFALASTDYMRKMQRFRDRAKAAEEDDGVNPTRDDGTGDDGSVENVLLGRTATHMKYQFDNGPARLQCRVLYAESFDAIRRKCGVADRFVESLSRCLKLDSKGGKSKSLFLQTHDKRFILKSLSAVEVQAFLKFAPDYFDFMSKCLFHSLPSSLAKMLGLYQVVMKNPVTGLEFNWFLQVMENVFYEGDPTHKFDLKGSMRNRKAEVTGQPDEVLLDENFLDFISHEPLHVRYHSSAILNNSITNDTLFCSKQNVMDYSLIMGLYEDRKEVVVGIIDYIRTYTWDKKLETWIKDRGSRKATVRSPKEYRTRFRRSIPTYFPHAPSTWQVFGTQRRELTRDAIEEQEVLRDRKTKNTGGINGSMMAAVPEIQGM